MPGQFTAAMENTPAGLLAVTGRSIQVKGEGTVAATRNVLAQCGLVGRENPDALPAPRDADIPLLRVGCGAIGGVCQQHVIDGFALRTVRRDGVTANELAIARRQLPPVTEDNLTGSFDL